MQLLLQWGSKKLLHILTVFIALGIQHAMRVRYIVICRPSAYTVLFHIISHRVRFS